MNCNEFEIKIQELVFDNIENIEVQKHLETCEECRNLKKEYEEMKVFLSEAEMIEPPKDLIKNVMLEISSIENLKRIKEENSFKNKVFNFLNNMKNKNQFSTVLAFTFVMLMFINLNNSNIISPTKTNEMFSSDVAMEKTIGNANNNTILRSELRATNENLENNEFIAMDESSIQAFGTEEIEDMSGVMLMMESPQIEEYAEDNFFKKEYLESIIGYNIINTENAINYEVNILENELKINFFEKGILEIEVITETSTEILLIIND